jgi:hypothetical protein
MPIRSGVLMAILKKGGTMILSYWDFSDRDISEAKRILIRAKIKTAHPVSGNGDPVIVLEVGLDQVTTGRGYG